MPKQASKKYENDGRLTLLRGGQYGAHRASAEVELERKMRAQFVRMRSEAERSPGRAYDAIAADEQHPWRVLARRIREARAAKVPRSAVQEMVDEIEQYVNAVYGVTATRKPAA